MVQMILVFLMENDLLSNHCVDNCSWSYGSIGASVFKGIWG